MGSIIRKKADAKPIKKKEEKLEASGSKRRNVSARRKKKASQKRKPQPDEGPVINHNLSRHIPLKYGVGRG